MKLLKQFYNYIVIAFCILLYIILRLAFGSSVIFYIIVPLIGFLLHFGITFYFDMKQKEMEASYEYISKNVDEKNESELNNIENKLRKLSDDNPIFVEVINQFLRKVDSFAQKEEALNALISMNDDRSKRFLQERSQATTSFIIANAKKLIKALIAYNAMSKRNRPSSVDEIPAVKEVMASLDDLTTNYDQLLEEVSKMGDDFNPEDPGLRDVVENLKEIRTSSNVEEDEPEEIHLFVNNSSSSSG